MAYKRIVIANKSTDVKRKFNNVKSKRIINLKKLEYQDYVELLTTKIFIPEKANITIVPEEVGFDSAREYEYHLRFSQDEKEGKIKHYIFKPERIPLIPSYKEVKIRPAYYLPDYLLIHNDNHIEIVDAKGFTTAEFMLKQKIVYDKYKLYVRIVK